MELSAGKGKPSIQMSYWKELMGQRRTSGSTEVADAEACVPEQRGRCAGANGVFATECVRGVEKLNPASLPGCTDQSFTDFPPLQNSRFYPGVEAGSERALPPSPASRFKANATLLNQD